MMKMITLTLIICFFCASLSAPPYPVVYIERAKVIQVFDPMLYAFQKVESNFRTNVVNHLGYTGILQEGPEMIAEANRICVITGNPQRFSFPESALDSLQSVHIWYIVQGYWNPQYTLKQACHTWNPLASINYYNKIKNTL